MDDLMASRRLREFGLLTGVVLALLFGGLLPCLQNAALPTWPWVTGGVIGVVGLLRPRLLAPVYAGWMKLGHVLGKINSTLILGVLFFLVFLPLGVVMRLLGKEPMARGFDATVSSYRVSSHPVDRQQIERPY